MVTQYIHLTLVVGNTIFNYRGNPWKFKNSQISVDNSTVSVTFSDYVSHGGSASATSTLEVC